MSTKGKNNRKMLNLAVNRKMQIRMIMRVTAVLFGSLLISSVGYYLLANEEITASFSLFHIRARNFLDLLLPVTIGAFFISLVAGVMASLFLPKTIAGSLYRIEEDLKKITQGDLTVTVRLREGDEGKAVAEQINRLTTDLSDSIATIQSAVNKAQALCSIDCDSLPKDYLNQLSELHDDINLQLSRYKL